MARETVQSRSLVLSRDGGLRQEPMQEIHRERAGRLRTDHVLAVYPIDNDSMYCCWSLLVVKVNESMNVQTDRPGHRLQQIVVSHFACILPLSLIFASCCSKIYIASLSPEAVQLHNLDVIFRWSLQVDRSQTGSTTCSSVSKSFER